VPDALSRVTAALAGRYEIERELGRGGMATVYLARDRKHDRPVALKVLRPELAAVLGAERFLREIRLTARLQHPHILTLIDSGEADGLVYYAMPFVDGESLRGRLERAGPLALEEAVQIVRAVAAALDHAHRQEIVHRDIKPENILLHQGEAMVADFGIALALSGIAGDRLTETGITLGTAAYMSPEQASAEPDLDGRADVYALGCVTYELLAGEPPYTGPTAHAIIAKCLSAPIPRLSTVRAVPPGVERAVSRALAKERADRFPTAGAFAAALGAAPAGNGWPPRRWLGVGAAALVAGLAAFVWLSGLGDALAAKLALGRGPGRVAVLYFDNLSPDSGDAYLADGLTDEIISRLGDVARLTVQSRAAVKRFRGHAADDPASVGRALGVSHLVTGSVRRAGARVRVAVELVNAGSGARVWGTTLDRADGDVLAIEDDIAQAVAGGVIGRLAPAERAALTQRATRNPEAYDHYLRGNFHLSRRASEADGRRALEEYQAALRLDPGFAAAYGRLGLVYGIYANWPWEYPGLTIDSLLARGLAAADRAIALDSGAPDGWVARGFLMIGHPTGETLAGFSLDPSFLGIGPLVCPPGVSDCPTQSLRALERAVRLDPRSAEAWYQYGRAQIVANRFGHPFASVDSALRHSLVLEPDRATSAWLLGLSYLRQRRWDDALTMLDSAIALRRRDRSVFSSRMKARLERGDVAGARADLDTLGRLLAARWPADSASAVYHASMTVVLEARRGDSTAARTRLAALIRRHPLATLSSPIMSLSLAAAHIAVGAHDQGLTLLEATRSVSWRGLQDALWDAVRQDPRFRQIENRARASPDIVTAEKP
jgi:TolB-like protein